LAGSRAGIDRKRAGVLTALCLLAAPVGLGGCVDTSTTASLAPDAEAHHQIARREGVSIAQASVAVVSIEGAPAAVAASLRQNLEREAQARDIVVVPAAKARYLVRGYLAATPTADGASIEYVWDVFTAGKRRAQRLNDVIAVKGSGDDTWALADEAALTSVAARSADDLAAYLSYTPEAAAPVASAGPASAGAPLAYAPQ
jgi:hypothetical protein